MTTLSIIVPVYNESLTIAELIHEIRAVSLRINKEIVVVDDGSTDGTDSILERINDNNIKIVSHSRNLGKGAGIKTGLEHVIGEIVIIQDADLEYNPLNYNAIIDPILNDDFDVVYGSRFLGSITGMTLCNTVGNRILTAIANLLSNSYLTDVLTGYKAMKTTLLKSLDLRSDSFEIDVEITAKLLRQGYEIHEVPISYTARRYSEGKKITRTDGFKLLFALLKYRFGKQ